jgi:AraC-like DNA-binding protein
MSWNLAYPLRPLFEGRELFVGEWYCPGQRRPRQRERAYYHEVDLMRTGAHVRTIGRQQHVVDATTAALHAPGNEYWMASPTDHPQRSTLVLLRGMLAEELAPRLEPQVRYVPPETARLHFQLLRATDPLEREETALALLHCVVSGSRAEPERVGPRPRTWRQLAEELRHLVATRFSERLTLEDMASAVHTSPFHASRVFRAVTGETLHRHLNRVRLRTALFELEHAAGRLTHVALSVGFSSHSHFTNAFQLEFGCAPSALIRGRR